VLPGVDEHLLGVRAKGARHRRCLDELRPVPDDCQNSHSAARLIFAELVIGRLNMDSLLRQIALAVDHVVWFLSYQADPREVRPRD
jgi:hypothetical protein